MFAATTVTAIGAGILVLLCASFKQAFRKFDPEMCFELTFEGRSIAFEVAEDTILDSEEAADQAVSHTTTQPHMHIHSPAPLSTEAPRRFPVDSL